MEGMIALAAGALAGGLAAYVAVYQQAGLAGLLVFSVRVVVTFLVLGQPPRTGGPTSLIDAFLARGGVPALVGALVGGGFGAYLGEEQRKREGKR